MLCRKLVFFLYVFQTFISSLPAPCYGMENAFEDKTPLTKKITFDKTVSYTERVVVSYTESPGSFPQDDGDYAASSGSFEGPDSVEINLDLDSRSLDKQPLKMKKTTSSQLQTITDEEIKTLRNNLNWYINEGIPVHFSQLYEQYNNTLEVRTGLIVSNLEKESTNPFSWNKTREFLDAIDENFFEGGRVPSSARGCRTWADAFWNVVWGSVVLCCGINFICYILSPLGLDPTRLFLAGAINPFPIQSDWAINFSMTMIIWHMLLYVTEGFDTSRDLYKRYAKNWGLHDTHGFMTKADDQYAILRSLKENNPNRKFREIEIAKKSVDVLPHIAEIPPFLNDSSRARQFCRAGFTYLEEFVAEYIYDGYNVLLMGEFSNAPVFENFKPGDVGLYFLPAKKKEQEVLYCKVYNTVATEIKKRNNSSRGRCIDEESFDRIIASLKDSSLNMTAEDREAVLDYMSLRKKKWGKDVADWTIDALELGIRETIFSTAPLIVALLYGLTFIDAEVYNGQALFGYFFTAFSMYVVFKTLRDSAVKWWRWDNHSNLNKADTNLKNKKKCINRSITKLREMINANTEDSNNYAITLYNGLTKFKESREDHASSEEDVLEMEKISKISLLFLKINIKGSVSYKDHQKKLREFLAKRSQGSETIPLRTRNGDEELEAIDSLANAPIDSLLESLNLKMLNLVKVSKPWLRSVVKKIGMVAGFLWAFPEFIIFSSVLKDVLQFVGVNPTRAYVASMALAGIVVLFDLCQGISLKAGSKRYSWTYASLYDQLSWSRPLSPLKWAALVPVITSAMWITSAYLGVIFDDKNVSDRRIQIALGVFAATSAPEIILLELQIIDKFFRSPITAFFINPLVVLKNLCANNLIKCINFCLISPLKNCLGSDRINLISLSTPVATKEKLYLNHHLNRLQEVKHEWDAETVTEYLHLQWGMQ